MKDLDGKTAFITGAASGIGFGIAEALFDVGMNIVLTDIEEEALQKAHATLSAGSNRVHAIRLDVTDRNALAAAADETERTFGPVHVVCNNAGVSNRGPLDQISYDDWDWVLGVNLGGVVNGVQTFLPRLKANHEKTGDGGHIVNTASIAGLLATAGNGVYATSKHAVVGLSTALRQELEAVGIGVSVLCPGTVDTQINHSARNRQAEYGEGGTDLSDEQLALLDESMAHGTAPREIGEYVLKAIRDDDFFILPHREFVETYRQRTDDILASFSDKPPTERQIESMRLRARAFGDFWDLDGPSTEEI